MYLAPQNIPRAISVLTLGNKVILCKRGSAERSSLKGRERAIVNQTNTGTVSKATLVKLLRDRMERIIIMGFSEHI